MTINVFAGPGLLGERIELEVGSRIRGIDVDTGFIVWAEGISTLRGIGVITGDGC
ncbi:MAG: hypothetical protein VX869_02250 [Chloroflexota bacterium]|nr:hypothetical protein [Chloroflexota bacterium]